MPAPSKFDLMRARRKAATERATLMKQLATHWSTHQPLQFVPDHKARIADALEELVRRGHTFRG